MNNSVRVVVTGMGAVTPIGLNLDDFCQALYAGRSGIGPITSFDAAVEDPKTGRFRFASRVAGEVKGFRPELFLQRPRRYDRASQLALCAAGMALKNAQLSLADDNCRRAGVIVGTGMGDMRTVEEGMTIMRDRGAEQIPPTGLLKVIPSSLPAHLAIHFGMRGPSFGVSSACASSTHAIGEAYRMIQRGDADVVLAGGAEASVTPLTVASFAAMQVLSRQNEPPYSTPRPFDRRRDGCVIGEGSGMLVLERLESARERGARIDAEVVGYGLTADAFHAGAMRPDAEECARAIRQALASAGVEAEQIDHVNAHGTATLSNDRVETLALRSALGPHAAEAPVSATKSMTGHLLSAGGAVETIAAVLAILTQKMHPTVNLTESDPECDLDYVPGMARVRSVRYALKNSFGFGGHNAVLVLKRWEE